MADGAPPVVEAVLFDLLTALLDSWTLWDRAAGDAREGRRWREHYLAITYGAGGYRPYEDLVREAAVQAGVPSRAATTLLDTWDALAPWPEAARVVTALRARGPVGVVTNCSEALAARAVARLGVPLDLVVTAERAGAYKPDARPYRLALAGLGCAPGRVLFVAGSPNDLPGAGGVGMPVAWHNRVGLPRPGHVAPPWVELATLDALPGLLAPGGA